MKKINVGIIGFGIGQKHFEAIHNYKGINVKVICDKNLEKIKKIKKKFPKIKITKNENEIFRDKEIQIVSIASYDNNHYSQIIKSIKNEKHIIIEKPMCLTFNQLKNIKKLIYKSKISITSNLVLRVNELFKKIKKKISNDKVFYVEADYIWGRKNKLFGWRSKIKDYSLILGAGIHMIDLVVWLLNRKPNTVHTFSNNIVTQNTLFKKQSMILMVFEFSNGIIAKITANSVAVHRHFHELKVFTKTKTITNTLQGSYTMVSNKIKKNNFFYPDKTNRKNLIRNFLDSFLEKKNKKIITIKDQFDLMSICLAAEKSLNKKKKIKINYI